MSAGAGDRSGGRSGGEQLALALVLPQRRARGREAFLVAPSNADAVAMIDRWRDWPDGRLALTGPEGAGKTHLAHVWMAAAGAEKAEAARLSAADAPPLVAAGAVVVEDVHALTPEAEPGLFHLMNLAAAEGARLLLTGRGAPQSWPAKTPDLASRLRALTAVAIAPPDEALLADLLARHLRNRQLRVDVGVVRYVAARLERSAAAAEAAAARLDAAAFREQRPITKPLAKKALGL